MTKKRFIVADRWIKDNCIGAWLNIDFNTITDANLCCDLLNRIEKEKRDNGKLASKLLEENEQLKSICKDHRDHAIDFKADCVRLEKENEELKKENENWKSIACDNSSFNSILLHELDIAKEQGYTVSDPFKKLMGKCE